MAIIPEHITYFNNSYGERKIFNALSEFNYDYIIFYSLMWSNRGNSKKNQMGGEADFVIFNPHYGMLVVEVKSGGIILEKGKWYRKRTDDGLINEMQNPFKQADRSKHILINLLEYQGKEQFIPVDKIVWFPSFNEIKKYTALPPYCAKETVLTRESFKESEKFIKEAFDYYNFKERILIKHSDINKIVAKLAPEFELVPVKGYKNYESRFSYLRLTNQQRCVIQYYIAQNNVCVEGMARTGKTIVALELANQVAKQGGKILFLCYNSLLSRYLKTYYESERLEIINSHNFIKKYLDKQLDNDEIAALILRTKKVQPSNNHVVLLMRPRIFLNLYQNKSVLYLIAKKNNFISFTTKIKCSMRAVVSGSTNKNVGYC